MNIIVTETPNFPPNLCAACGTCRSEFFVDTGIQLEVYFNPVIYNGPGFEGAVLLCASCWDNLVRVGSHMVALHRGDRSDRLSANSTESEGFVDRTTVEDDRGPEPDDSESTGSDSESDPDGPDEAVSEFRGFFFGQPA